MAQSYAQQKIIHILVFNERSRGYSSSWNLFDKKKSTKAEKCVVLLFIFK
jgi:hypothetical protein